MLRLLGVLRFIDLNPPADDDNNEEKDDPKLNVYRSTHTYIVNTDGAFIRAVVAPTASNHSRWHGDGERETMDENSFLFSICFVAQAVEEHLHLEIPTGGTTVSG